VPARPRAGSALALRRREERDRRPDASARRCHLRRSPRGRLARRWARRAGAVLLRLVARPPGRAGLAAARARGARARLLERAFAERGRPLPRHPARHRQDADAQRSRASGRPARRGVPMTPDFDELVGTDLEPEERERLMHAHDLLIAAGAPPELPPGLADPTGTPEAEVIPFWNRRRNAVLAVLAAALAALAFGIGYLTGNKHSGPSFSDGAIV